MRIKFLSHITLLIHVYTADSIKVDIDNSQTYNMIECQENDDSLHANVKDIIT